LVVMPLRAERVEDLLRRLAPQVLGALMRRNGHFDACEDAVQEAMLDAATQWPARGMPDNPAAWLTTVATRRLADQARSESARRRREDVDASRTPRDAFVTAASDEPAAADDDTLRLLLLCCHPALTPASQVALTLRAVGGLTTAEIANAFLVPEATMAQRISRAKHKIKAAGATFTMPSAEERDDRLRAVLHVLYLVFNEGYASTAGPQLQRSDLTAEAIRLTRALHELLPDDGEVTGLLALMLLTEARRAARTSAAGALVPLDEQDRSRWDQALIAEGVELVTHALGHARLGPYQVQAAIAAVHDDAPTVEDTDWPQILALYGVLEQLTPNPVVALNRAVAVAMVHGPAAGLAVLDTVATDERMAGNHRLHAVRGHLLEMAGDLDAALADYREAARRTRSLPERRHLERRVHRLAHP
jgi:RNA polymerase sigma factor (sigma-70 family)